MPGLEGFSGSSSPRMTAEIRSSLTCSGLSLTFACSGTTAACTAALDRAVIAAVGLQAKGRRREVVPPVIRLVHAWQYQHCTPTHAYMHPRSFVNRPRLHPPLLTLPALALALAQALTQAWPKPSPHWLNQHARHLTIV